MKYLIMVLSIAVALSCGIIAEAGRDGKKGPSDRAYERANENAAFKRDKDWAPGNHKDKRKKKHDHDDSDSDDKKGKHKHKGKHKNKHKDDDHDHHKDGHDDGHHDGDEHGDHDSDDKDDSGVEELLNETK